MSLGKCCVAGFVHGGEPTGKMETINGALTYVALPANGGDKTKALLFFTDVFGMALKNNKVGRVLSFLSKLPS